jgi:hypothetical protein
MLGLGCYFHHLAQSLNSMDLHQPSIRLRDLTPYDHLDRGGHLCFVHLKQRAHEIYSECTVEEYNAILSLAATEIHPDVQGVIDLLMRSESSKVRGM